jgi:hypothetical protein
MPRSLTNAIRLRRYGAPWEGGWMSWPVRWLIDTETAEDAYTALTEVNRAMSRLEGERLEEWQRDNAKMVRRALEIEALLDAETNEGDTDNG